MVNYRAIINLLEGKEDLNEKEDYARVLGEYYNEEYFSQSLRFRSYVKTIFESELFSSELDYAEREEYVHQIIIYVFDAHEEDTDPETNNVCDKEYDICARSALRTHKITVGSCMAGAVVLGALTGGAGAAGWPICMATSGLIYDSNMTACREYRDICRDQK